MVDLQGSVRQNSQAIEMAEDLRWYHREKQASIGIRVRRSAIPSCGLAFSLKILLTSPSAAQTWLDVRQAVFRSPAA